MNKIAKALLVAALASLPLMAAQSENAVRVSAPFEFVAGEAVLPAGQYEISADQLTGVVTLTSLNSGLRSFVAGTPIETYNREIAPRLEFRKMGSAMVLEKVLMDNAAAEFVPQPTESSMAPAVGADD